MTTQLDLLDAAILVALKHRPSGTMTYVVRNILSMEHGYPRIRTGAILRRLKRMELAGIVERVPSSYLAQLCWRACP